MDATLIALLRFSKQEHCEPTWQALRDQVFTQRFGAKLELRDVLSVLLKSYEAALEEPRFEIPSDRQRLTVDLLLSPIDGPNAVGFFPEPDAKYTVEQCYGAMIRRMLGHFRLARVDWCTEELGLDTSVPSLP